MAEPPSRSASPARKTPPPRIGFLWPAMVGGALGTAVALYLFWSHLQARHVAETVADPGLATPTPAECAIAKSALTAIHVAGEDARWEAGVGATTMTLKAHSQVINPVDVPGYTDDEADDVRGKGKADWRLCPGMDAFVRGLHWSAMSGDIDDAELGLSRPGVSKTGDEAKLYESFSAPAKGDNPEAPRQARGPWLATLVRVPDGAWRVTAIGDLSRHSR